MWLSENNFVLHSVSHETRNIFVTKTSKIWSQTHKNPMKNAHKSAQKSKIFSPGDPPNPLTTGGIILLSCSPPPLSCALDGFLRQTTFQYAATALRKGSFRVSIIVVSVCNLNLALTTGSLAEVSLWSAVYLSEQQRFWLECVDAQTRLNLCCSYLQNLPSFFFISDW